MLTSLISGFFSSHATSISQSDRLVLHHLHVLGADDVHAARRGDEDVALRGGLLHRRDLVAFHGRLERDDGVDLRDDDARAEAAERLRAPLADVAVAGHDSDLAGEHDARRALQPVPERLAAAVEVVELRLRDRVVDVERGDLELPLLVHLVEPVDARRRLLREAADGVRPREEVGVLLVDDDREVAAVVQDHVGALAPLERDELLLDAVLVLGLGLALPGEDGDAGRCDGRRGVVLGRVDVAAGPGDLGAERGERLDEHGGLHRHVEAARDASPLERLRLAVLGSERHEPGHLALGDRDFLPTPLRERDVLHLEIVTHD
jgi:hypothetical protein